MVSADPLTSRLRRRLGVPSKQDALELLYNRLLTHVPHNGVRLWYLRRIGLQAGHHTYLFGGSEVIEARRISITGNCHVGRFCQLDGRGGIQIGRNVVIASHTLLITADHDPQSPGFDGRLGPIFIGDRVWIGSRAVVLRDVIIGEGAVVAAGSVVHRDVDPWTIISGVPAQPIGERQRTQTYEIEDGPVWY